MIIGEIRKVFRNKVFLVMLAAIMLANIVSILYCARIQEESYYEYMQDQQLQYIETYKLYIDEMGSRGTELLAALDGGDSAFMKRNVEKTERDYSGLSDLEPDTEYHAGVEEYAGYTYGIFFCIIFAFVCLEYLYLFEKRSGSIHILRSAKKGRWQMILSKWFVFLLLLFFFTLLQEVITVCLYGQIYSLGNLSGPIQSLSIFRDCPNAYSMLVGIIVTILNRIIISLGIGSIIFFFGIVSKSVILAFVIPCVILAMQYIFSITISVNSSYDKLCCINFFHSWNMKNYLGIYHNLNIGGVPIEKNTAVLWITIVIIICAVGIGTIIFSICYQEGYKKHEFRLLAILRRQLSKILHIKSIGINEFYKLLFQQKKWILIVLFAGMVINSMDQYIPRNIYQTAYEATYHMYLSNIQGKVDEESEQFIRDEQEYVDTLEQKLQEAIRSGDSGQQMQLSIELEGRRKAFDRLMAQYNKLLEQPDTDKYFIDELNLSTIMNKYDRDVLLFMMSVVILILMVSGLYASEKENKISNLIYATRNGRKKLLKSKLRCSMFLIVIIFIFAQLPGWIGYGHIFKMECLKQRLYMLYQPEINSTLTLAGMLVLIYLLKLMLYVIIVLLTILMARKTKNEFITSVFMSTVIIVASLVVYFLKTNITLIFISIL
jgi:hypothetical protein